MTFRIKKGDHGVFWHSNVGSANIVVSYWRRRMVRTCHMLYIKYFFKGGGDMYHDPSVQSSI